MNLVDPDDDDSIAGAIMLMRCEVKPGRSPTAPSSRRAWSPHLLSVFRVAWMSGPSLSPHAAAQGVPLPRGAGPALDLRPGALPRIKLVEQPGGGAHRHRPHGAGAGGGAKLPSSCRALPCSPIAGSDLACIGSTAPAPPASASSSSTTAFILPGLIGLVTSCTLGFIPDQHAAVTGPSSNGSHGAVFYQFIAAFREGRLDFQKKYSESLNPYAMRFITLILLFTPSSTLVCIG